MRIFFLSAFTISIILSCGATRVSAQTVAPWQEKILIDNCSQGRQIVSLEHTANSHIAKQDPLDTVSPFLAKAAALSQACAASTPSPYARDWYQFSWANDIFRSATSASDAQAKWPPAIKRLHTLAISSKYQDVKSAAQQSYDLARAAVEQSGVH